MTPENEWNDPDRPSGRPEAPNIKSPGTSQPSGTSAWAQSPSSSEAARARSPSAWPILLTSIVLSLACGGFGAWAFETYLKKKEPKPEVAAAPAAAPTPAPASVGSDEATKALKDQLASLQKSVQGRIDGVEEQINAIPKEQYRTDIKDLKDRLAAVEKNIGGGKSEGALEARVAALEKSEGHETTVKSLEDRIKTVEAGLASLRTSQAALEPGNKPGASTPSGSQPSGLTTRREAAKPPAESANLETGTLPQGTQLFDKKDYSGALKVFQALQASHPEDARVWYFSALARGFSTGDWRNQTQQWAEKGSEREKAQTPPSSEIDAAFNNLTKETGKDWLAYYRQRAKR
jgi:TolA-binding protein